MKKEQYLDCKNKFIQIETEKTKITAEIIIYDKCPLDLNDWTEIMPGVRVPLKNKITSFKE